MKTSMTSLDVAAVVEELNHFLVDWRINNVYEPEHGRLLLKLRSAEGLFKWLLIEGGKRLHLTSYEVDAPPEPTQFCRGLRRHVRNGIVEAVSQYNLDRVVELKVRSGTLAFLLIVEIMDRGNILLLEDNNIIKLASKYGRLSGRNVRKGEKYTFPQSRGSDPLEVTPQQLSSALSLSKADVVRALVQAANLAGEVAEEVCRRARIDEDRPASGATPEDAAKILAELHTLVGRVWNLRLAPRVYKSGDGMLSVCPMEFEKYRDAEATEFATFNEACDHYFGWLDRVSKSAKPEAEIEKWRVISAEQRAYAKKLSEEALRLRSQGQLVLSNLHTLEPLLQRLSGFRRQGLSGERFAAVLAEARRIGKEPLCLVEGYDPAKSRVSVGIGGAIVELDLNASTAENGSDFFSNAKELERKAQSAIVAAEDSEKKIQEAESVQLVVTREPPKRRVRTKWYERFRWCLSSDGFLLVGGRDASQNEAIVRRYLEKGDILMHADIHGSPAVVIKADGRQISEAAIKQAAQFAVAYSSAWKGEFAHADSYWVHPNQVSLSPPSGEYLPKGGIMVRGKKNYLHSVPLKLAIGLLIDGSPMLMAGPAEAVSTRTELYALLKPGGQPREKVAHMIRHMFKQALGVEGATAEAPNETEILGVMPSGGAEIVAGR